jgi:hypothetical protein
MNNTFERTIGLILLMVLNDAIAFVSQLLRNARKFFFCFLTSGLFLVPSICQSADVIVNGAVGVKEISAVELRSIYVGHIKSWPNGLPIRLVIMKEGSLLHDEFTKKRLNLFPYQLKRALDRYVFSGGAVSYVVVQSQDEMIDKVISTPGAVGYVEKNTGIPFGVTRIRLAYGNQATLTDAR